MRTQLLPLLLDSYNQSTGSNKVLARSDSSYLTVTIIEAIGSTHISTNCQHSPPPTEPS